MGDTIRGEEAHVFSGSNPCGWVRCRIIRTVERGRRKGWYVVGFWPESGYEGRIGRRPLPVNPDLVRLEGESLPPMGGDTALAALGISKDRGRR